MSASLANDSRARPNVLGFSTTDMDLPSPLSPISPSRPPVPPDVRSGACASDVHTVARQVVDRSAPDLLVGGPSVHDDRRGRTPRPTAIEEIARDRRRAPDPHHYPEG